MIATTALDGKLLFLIVEKGLISGTLESRLKLANGFTILKNKTIPSKCIKILGAGK